VINKNKILYSNEIMNKEIIIVILVIFVLSYYVDETFVNSEVTMVVSNIDGRRYIVRNLPDKQKAANMLGRINESLMKFITYLQKKFPNDERVQELTKNYSPDNMSEGGDNDSYTTYSVNKGEQLIVCLRQKATNQILDLNTLLYVIIHEASHIMLKNTIGHTKDFWKNFKWLLGEAVEAGIYTSVDYGKTPVKYCGIEITSNILNDPSYDEKKEDEEGHSHNHD
jgi:hypothetical protein